MSTRSHIPGLELVKVLALVCMLVDHVDLILFDRAHQWAYELGRFALPAFFGAYAVGLARSADPARSALGLVVPGVIAQVAWQLAGQEVYATGQLNVLLSAAFLAVVVATLRESRAIGAGLVLLSFACFPVFEGGYITLAVFYAGYLAASTSRKAVVLLAAAPVMAATPGLAGLLGLAAPHLSEHLPGVRARVLPFAWVYVAHLAALVALRAVVLA